MNARHRTLSTSLVIAIASGIVTASAQTTLTWNGGASSNHWSATDNWTPSATPVSGDTVNFGDVGGDTTGSNAVTSVMDLPAQQLATLSFAQGTGVSHHVDLDGNALKVTDLFRVAENTFGQTTEATISNGTLLLGDASARIPDVRVGFRTAAGGNVIGTVSVAVSNFTAYAGNLDIGRIEGSSQQGVRGTLELTQCNAALIDAIRVYVGTISGNLIAADYSAGTLLLPLTGTARIRATDFWVGESTPAGNQPPLSVVELGNTATLEVDNLTIGRSKSRGEMRFASGVSGGVLTIRGKSKAGADVHVGYNTTGTATTSDGGLQLGGGALDATLDQLVIGRHGSGSGSGKGTLIMDAGTVTVNRVTLAIPDDAGSSTTDANTTGWLEMNGGYFTVSDSVLDGNGFSSVMVDAGHMSVSNAFQSDDFRVGQNIGSGTIDVDGPVRLGDGSSWIDIGIREGDDTTTTGLADFSDAPSVTINADLLRIGYISTGGGMPCSGTLLLSETGTNSLSLNALHVGDSGNAGNTVNPSIIHFGSGSNHVAVNEINIGQRKSIGVATVSEGGTVVMTARDGGRADLYLGRNNHNTGTHAQGTLAMTNGTLVGTFDDVVLGVHNVSSGSGKGLLEMGPGMVSANRLILSQPNAGGTSTNPQNTHGTLRMLDGRLDVLSGGILDLGGTSWIDVRGGTLTTRGNVSVDTVDLSTGGASNATFVLNSTGGDQGWEIGTLAHGSGATLKINIGGGSSTIETIDTTFEAGARLSLGVTDGGAPNINETEGTRWMGESNTWDDVADAHWSDGVPAAHAIVSPNDTFTILVASNSLVNAGLTVVDPGWELAVTTGPTGRIDATRTGEALENGQRFATINASNAVVTRPGGLLIGDAPGSGAGASGLAIYDGRLDVAGDIVDDGGHSVLRMEGGELRVDGGCSVDSLTIDGGDVRVNGGVEAGAFRLGYLGQTAALSASNGFVRIVDTNETAVIDIARREGNSGIETRATADFRGADGVVLAAASLRIGTAETSNGPKFKADITFSATGTNLVTAGTLTISDSPQEGNNTLPGGYTNALHFGGASNQVNADVVYVGRRKSVGRADILPGGTLTMRGTGSAGTMLRIAFNDVDTGTFTGGTLDLSGATFNADLNQLLVARHNAGSGGAEGAFIMDNGRVTVADNVELARISVGGTSSAPERTIARVEFNGGTVDVGGEIAGGGGVSRLTLAGADVTASAVRNIAELIFSGGSLATADITLGTNLAQSGGLLLPGGDGIGATAVHGDYDVNGGGWQIGIAGTTNDMVTVDGALTLEPGASITFNKVSEPTEDFYVVAEYGSRRGKFEQVSGLSFGRELVYDYGTNANQIVIIERGTLLIVR